MSPIFEYRCGNGHLHEDIRAFAYRDKRTRCPRCKRLCKRIPSLPHVEPDGVHSYAPNIGSPDRFERQQQAIREAKDEGRATKAIDRT